MGYKIGDIMSLPNNTKAEITRIEKSTNNWCVYTGYIDYYGTILSSNSTQIVGKNMLISTRKEVE